MSRETIKCLVDMIPEKDIDTIYKVLVRFVPEDASPTVPHDAINWD